MRKTVIDNFKIGETVSLISYNPPLQGRIIDMYELNPVMVSDETLKKIATKVSEIRSKYIS